MFLFVPTRVAPEYGAGRACNTLRITFTRGKTMRRLDGKPDRRKGRFIDLTGRVFGKLTVIKLVKTEDRQWVRQKATVRWYLCRCECGKEKTLAGPSLTKDQRVRSCGCLLKEWKKTYESRSRLFKKDTAFRRVIEQYKRGAKDRDLCWELTDEQFRTLTLSPCHYTGLLPSTVKEVASGEQYIYNGIDRIDSGLGYTLDNCVPCCRDVNFMKKNMTYERFIKLCKAIAERF